MKKSHLIVPISIAIHLAIINIVLSISVSETYAIFSYALYYNISWLILTFSLDFYETDRKEKFFTNFFQFVQLLMLYALCFFALYGFIGVNYYTIEYNLVVFFILAFCLTSYRILFYIARSKYRIKGGNYRKVVVIGNDKNLEKIKTVFKELELGYRYMGFFDDRKSNTQSYLGKMNDSFEYILKNDIDYIYCMASKLSRAELKALITFADNNLKKLKIIPDNKEIFSRSMSIELYDSIPVLAMRKSPLEMEYAPLLKRTFDIIFSSVVIITILSWLTPIIYVLMKFDSKGPLIFKQKRHGVNKKSFLCYKFRSMTTNQNSDTLMATKGDMRVTKLGEFMRKTSIDELPQFFNVLKGDMSVVGPRPHMEAHTEKYQRSIDKYLVRHFVKPGITGLAQIKGYRGEILNKADIVNRIRFDIFYFETWSIGLDINIIYATMINAINGEEKAY